MSHETQQKLFSFLSQEFGVQALQSDMSEIERIVSNEDIKLLNISQCEIRACYERIGVRNSNVLMSIDARLDEMLFFEE